MEKRSQTRLTDGVFRHHWISEAAYYRAEYRNFAPGKELDDWLHAETEYIKMQIKRYLSIIHEDGGTTIKGLQRLAKMAGVENPESITLEIELIHAIQRVSKQNPCCNSEPVTNCHDKEHCLWKTECRKMIAKWCR